MSKHRIIPYEILLETVKNTGKILDLTFPNQLEVLRTFVRGAKRTVEDCIKMDDEGLPIVGHHFTFPGELLQAFDCVPVGLEATTYLLSALLTVGSEPYYDLADSRGHPYHACTSQKGIIGMSLDKLFEFDAIVTPASPCDNTMASYPIIQYYNKGVKLIVGDMPNYRNERSIEYTGKELKIMTEELSKVLGQEPDYEKLRKAIESNNKALEYLSEINELKKNVPSPFPSILCPCTTGAYPIMLPKHKVEFFREILEIGKKRYRNNVSIIGGEKARVLFPYMSVFFDLGFCIWMDQMGMNVLFDMFSYLFLDPIDVSQDIDSIFKDIGRQALNYPMTRQSQGSGDIMIEDSVFLAREYKADFAVFTAHLGCKQGVSLIQLVREALRDEIGIPMLTIDIDVGDKRMTSINTVKREIFNFFGTVDL